MKILFVAMGNSMHSLRWIRTVRQELPHCELSLYSSHTIPTVDLDLSRELDLEIWNGSMHTSKALWDMATHPLQYARLLVMDGLTGVQRELKRRLMGAHWRRLARIIRREKPDLIHSLHTQTSGYLLMKVRERWDGHFPVWVHSLWGSDLFYCGKFDEHREKISAIMQHIDFLVAEGERDGALAREHGFRGILLESVPACGGFDLPRLARLRPEDPPSRRREISIKGYQNTVGRFFVGLRALARVRDLLEGYVVNVYLAESEVERTVAEAFSADTGIRINIVANVSHDEILEMHGRSRISIALSTSDGLPASLLEAMAMGAFPVQSDTSMAAEWVADQETGMLVPPEDPDHIEAVLRKALLDDELVDRAAERNRAVVEQRLDNEIVSRQIHQMYERVIREGV